MDILVAKQLGEFFLLPPFNLAILCLFGMLLIRRGWRLGAALVWFSVLASFAVGLPLWGYLHAQNDRFFAYDKPNLEDAQAIVILGGGRRLFAPEYSLGETVSSGTLERLRYGAMVARESHLPILVSGGKPSNGMTSGEHSEASHMARAKMAFESSGLNVIAAPIVLPQEQVEGLRLSHFLPSFAGYAQTRNIIYAWFTELRGYVLTRLQ
jgi:uncharacterized SAM-binding protein YcdF (DUF218 family)